MKSRHSTATPAETIVSPKTMRASGGGAILLANARFRWSALIRFRQHFNNLIKEAVHVRSQQPAGLARTACRSGKN